MLESNVFRFIMGIMLSTVVLFGIIFLTSEFLPEITEVYGHYFGNRLQKM